MGGRGVFKARKFCFPRATPGPSASFKLICILTCYTNKQIDRFQMSWQKGQTQNKCISLCHGFDTDNAQKAIVIILKTLPNRVSYSA